MRPRRPWPVTATAVALILAGSVGLAYHATALHPSDPTRLGTYWLLAVRAAAIVIGGLLLRGVSAARWGALGWMLYQVVWSAFRSPAQAVTHLLVATAVTYCLFGSSGAAYYRGAATSR